MIDSNTLLKAELRAISAKLAIYAGATDNFELHKQLQEANAQVKRCAELVSEQQAREKAK